MKWIFILCLSCSSATSFYGQDGKVMTAIRCRGDMLHCYEEAGDACGAAGYHVYRQGGIPNASGPYGSDFYSNSLLISCNEKKEP